MAFIPGYSHDIFLSYAHRDNGEDIAPPGWIHAFADILEANLKVQLTSPQSDSLDIYWDYQVRGNEPLSEQLKKEIHNSALFIVVAGQHYYTSAWCKRELSWFSKAVIDRHRADSRLFLIRKEPRQLSAYPNIFEDLLGYDFFDESRRPKPATLAWPNARKNDQDAVFYEKVGELVSELSHELQILAASPPDDGVSESSFRAAVFLAASCENTLDERESLRHKLEKNGMKVFPEESSDQLMADPDLFNDVIDRHLPRCDLAVQVLGEVCTPFPGQPLGWIGWQKERFDRADKPRLYWLSPTGRGDSIRNKSYSDFLNMQPELNRNGLDEFCNTILAQLASRESHQEEAHIFCNFSAQDHVASFVEEILRRIREIWHRNGLLKPVLLSTVLPQHGVAAKRFDDDRRRQLARCDGHCIVYGDTERDWVWQQIAEERKAKPLRKKEGKRTMPVCRIIDGPPPDVEFAAFVSDHETLNFRHKINEKDLELFLKEIATGIRQHG